MKRRRPSKRSEHHPPVLTPSSIAPRPRRPYARWRALSLSLVYVVFALHILHWKLTGRTLAPLELNEVMYTLELGIITAGFLFMCFLVLGTLIFGRFFCSWACHIIVLQDLCAWILGKFGVRRKPIRSRMLLLVPPITAFYMFIWPQIVRGWQSRAFPQFHFRSDAEGWASFATENFWRNLPGPAVIVLTLVVCGFVIIYLLGSRTFCTYVCPYGAIFALADRFSPGRILVNDKCQQCGTCTAACTCGIRVHEEVKTHGRIVNPACLKDLDCVAACPQDALRYALAKPALFKSFKSGGRFGRLPYDFSLWEELLIAIVFIACLLSFRGLYSRIPFLLSLTFGAILGYLAVVTVRLCTRPEVRLATLRLKTFGRISGPGRAYAVIVALLTAFVCHSAVIRYHEYLGLKQAMARAEAKGGDHGDALARSAREHLLAADRWGLVSNERVEWALLELSFQDGQFQDVEAYARRLLDRHPYHHRLRLRLGQSLADRGRTADAEQAFRLIIAQSERQAGTGPPGLASAHQALGELLANRGDFVAAAGELQTALDLDPNRANAWAAAGSVLAELGRLDEAVGQLRTAVRLDPSLGRAHYNLGTLLAHQGRFDDAINAYEQALSVGPTDAQLHNNIGFALLRTGKLDRSMEHLEHAVALDPASADAHFNLGTLLAERGQVEDASKHFRTAARLDPQYARLWPGGS